MTNSLNTLQADTAKVQAFLPPEDTREYTGGSVSYYRVTINRPTSKDAAPYVAECNDIIEALGMNYAEGNAFKAIWRSCAARHLKLSKRGYDDAIYDAEKVVFFAQRMVEQAKADKAHTSMPAVAASCSIAAQAQAFVAANKP